MSITLYGTPRNRTFRVLWMLEELGLPYRHVACFGPDLLTPEYQAINPQSKVPALADGDLTITESYAINLHLALTHPSALWPDTAQAQARILQWTLFAATELDNWASLWAVHTIFRSPEARDPALARLGAASLERPLRALDQALGKGGLVPGHDFTLADLNLAATLFTVLTNDMPSPDVPALTAWFARATSRPDARRAIAARAANVPVADLPAEGVPA